MTEIAQKRALEIVAIWCVIGLMQLALGLWWFHVPMRQMWIVPWTEVVFAVGVAKGRIEQARDETERTMRR